MDNGGLDLTRVSFASDASSVLQAISRGLGYSDEKIDALVSRFTNNDYLCVRHLAEDKEWYGFITARFRGRLKAVLTAITQTQIKTTHHHEEVSQHTHHTPYRHGTQPTELEKVDPYGTGDVSATDRNNPVSWSSRLAQAEESENNRQGEIKQDELWGYNGSRLNSGGISNRSGGAGNGNRSNQATGRRGSGVMGSERDAYERQQQQIAQVHDR